MVSKVSKKFPIFKKLGKVGVALAVIALVNSNAFGGDTSIGDIVKANKSMGKSIEQAEMMAKVVAGSVKAFELDDANSLEKFTNSDEFKDMENISKANSAETNSEQIKREIKNAQDYAKTLHPNITDDQLKQLGDTVAKNFKDSFTGGKGEKELKDFVKKTLDKVSKNQKVKKSTPDYGSDEYLLSPL